MTVKELIVVLSKCVDQDAVVSVWTLDSGKGTVEYHENGRYPIVHVDDCLDMGKVDINIIGPMAE